MAVGDNCPVEIPCMDRQNANKFNFLRLRKPRNYTYTELKNNGIKDLIPCDQVSFDEYVIVLDFQTDYQTYEDGNQNDQLFSPTLDILDDSETPRWKTTDKNVDDINAETPDWDFPNSDDKFVICCLKRPDSGNLPKVDLLFEADNDSGDEPANNSYIKGEIDISEFDEIGTVDFALNRQMTGVDFGNRDRYLDLIDFSQCDLTDEIDLKNTTGKKIYIGNNSNITTLIFKQSDEEVNEIIAVNNNHDIDLSGVTIKSGNINFQNITGDITLDSSQEYNVINTSGSEGALNNFQDITLLVNCNIYFLNHIIGSPTLPSNSNNLNEINFNGIGWSNDPDFSPWNGIDINGYLNLSSNSFINVDLSPLNDIANLSMTGNSNLASLTLPSGNITELFVRGNNLAKVYNFGVDISPTTSDISSTGLTQSQVDDNLNNLNDNLYEGDRIDISNSVVGGTENAAPSGLDSNGDIPASPTAGTGADYIKQIIEDSTFTNWTIVYYDDVNGTNKTVS